MNIYNKFIEKTIADFKKYIIENKINDIVIGISGGIDSAVSLGILSLVPKINIHAYFIDINSSINNLDDAKKISKLFNIKLEIVKLENIYNDFIKLLNIEDNIRSGNIKSRIRTLFLYDQASKFNGLVIGNLNYDEKFLGYFTKNSDNACDYMFLNNLIKSDIIKLAHLFNIPENIVNKAPSADLYNNQTDEGEFGFKYEDIDKFLASDGKIEKIIENKIIKRHDFNTHKNNIISNRNYIKKYRGM